MKDDFGSMRIVLKLDTIKRIEKLAGQRLTTKCDKVINKVLDEAERRSGKK